MTSCLNTGGAGFIGSHFLCSAVKKGIFREIVVLDSLTYCGSLDNISDMLEGEMVQVVEGDVCDQDRSKQLTLT